MASFKELLEFPCVIDFRIIVVDEKNILETLLKFIDENYKGRRQDSKIEERKSSKGNYISYTIGIKVESEDEIKDIYKKLCSNSYVKHVI